MKRGIAVFGLKKRENSMGKGHKTDLFGKKSPISTTE